MRVGPYDFRPDLLPTLAALLFLAGLISLGLWQLDRANTKKAWETAYLSRRALPPVALRGRTVRGDRTAATWGFRPGATTTRPINTYSTTRSIMVRQATWS